MIHHVKKSKYNTINEEMYAGLQESLLKANFPDNYGSGMGRGVIYVGGGPYWAGIVVGCKLLRECGFTDAIEVWHRGELEPVDPTDVAGLDVTIINTLEVASRYGDSSSYIESIKGKFGGWSAKSYVLTHTNLDQVLYLDADAYCVNNPSHLFGLLSEKSPFVFWKDLPHQIRTIKWPLVYPPGHEVQPPPVQGGQLLLDRRYTGKLLNAFHYICQNGKFYWEDNPQRLMYGDQDAWRIGMAANACGYTSLGFARWNKVAFICSYENNPIVIHRCQGKLFAPGDIPVRHKNYANPHYELPKETRVFDLFAEFLNKRGYDSTTIFKSIYDKRLWGKGSGAGSTIREGQLYIDRINSLLLAKKDIQSIIDLGSGDGVIASRLGASKYIGLDVSEEMVRLANKQYNVKNTYKNISFFPLDFYEKYDIIPVGDAVLCKDVFHHWPTKMIVQFLDNLENNNRWKYWIFCCDDHVSGQSDTYLGGYRAIRLDSGELQRFKLKRIADVHHKGLYLREFR